MLIWRPRSRSILLASSGPLNEAVEMLGYADLRFDKLSMT